MKRFFVFVILITLLIPNAKSQTDWREELAKQLPALGHRNWILVADAAYPVQIKPGIQTLVTGEELVDVVEEVLKAVNDAPHLAADIMLDKEIDFVPEKEVPNIKKVKKQLDKLLKDEKVTMVLHEQLLEMVDEAGENFQVLVLKTNLTVPYTSVFIRLDCGYWNTEQESEMREMMK